MPERSYDKDVYTPKKASDFSDRGSKGDKRQSEETKRRMGEINKQFEDIPALSQREQEHLTYLAVYEKYNEFKIKRMKYRDIGTIFIIVSALIFIVLMFSHESKIAFLCLWVITILGAVFFMLRADYGYNMYKEMLGICDEFDIHDYDSDDETGEPPKSEKKKENTEQAQVQPNTPDNNIHPEGTGSIPAVDVKHNGENTSGALPANESKATKV